MPPPNADATQAVLIVDDDDGFVDDAQKLFDSATTFTARNISDAQRRLVDEAIDLVLIGPGFAHETGVAEASLLFDVDPDKPLVLVADVLSTDVLKAALRAGFRDVIEAPLTVRKVEDALALVDRITRREEAAAEGKRGIGKIVTIMSPKGGAGKTMTTTNVALALTGWSPPGRVVIVDADLQFGDVCISLSLEPKHTIVDAARDYDKLDQPLLESLLTRHRTGLRVLAAPLEPSLADEVSTEVVVKVLNMLKRTFDYVVVDTAPFLDEPVLSILERSDDVLLVVDMDLPSVKNAKLALDTLRLIKYPFEKIKLILNRVNSKARLDVEELERSLGLSVKGAVSSDKLVPRAVNEGDPVVSLYPRSKVARDLRNVSRLVLEADPSVDGGEETEEKQRKWFRP